MKTEIESVLSATGFGLNMSEKDLVALTEERPVRSVDQFEPNAFYGNSHVLKMFAGVEPGFSLDRIIPHGVNLSREPWDVEISHPVKTILCHSEAQGRDYPESGFHKAVVPIGAPYYYASRLVNMVLPSIKRNPHGIVVFPAHSTHQLTANYEQSEWFMALGHLKEFYDVTICLYWRDIQLGYHKPYLESGFDVTTCGHMFDDHFLIRLAWILKHHHHAYLNRLGSCAYYSAAEGLDISYFNQDVQFTGPKENLDADLSKSFDTNHAQAFFNSFSLIGDARRSVQFDIAHSAIGGGDLKSPEELHEILVANQLPDWKSITDTSQPVQKAESKSSPLTPNVLDALSRI